MKIFVAGATGAVGLPLVRALCTLGHQVVGTTRAGPGVDRLREIGASAVTADAFDRQALRDAIAAAAPDVVIDQLTWLPANPADIIKPMPNDTRLHEEGGGNLFPALAQPGIIFGAAVAKRQQLLQHDRHLLAVRRAERIELQRVLAHG